MRSISSLLEFLTILSLILSAFLVRVDAVFQNCHNSSFGLFICYSPPSAATASIEPLEHTHNSHIHPAYKAFSKIALHLPKDLFLSKSGPVSCDMSISRELRLEFVDIDGQFTHFPSINKGDRLPKQDRYEKNSNGSVSDIRHSFHKSSIARAGGASAVSIPLLLIQTQECGSTGNHQGVLYEMIAFAQKYNFAVGRIGVEGNCYHLANNHSLLNHFPRLIIPTSLSDHSAKQFDKSQCNEMKTAPWEFPESLFWSKYPLFSALNSHMANQYLMANEPTALIESKGLLAVHYRCTDNLSAHNMGVFRFSVYKRILADIVEKHVLREGSIKRVMIFSDAAVNREFGILCWGLVGSLRDLIADTKGLEHIEVDVQHGNPLLTFSLLHAAEVTVCPVSTFCLFASFGGKHVYFPQDKGLVRIPQSFWQEQSSSWSPISNVETAWDVRKFNDWQKFLKDVVNTRV